MRLLFLCFLILLTTGIASAGQCVIDDLQEQVCLENSPEKIISLSPHITELIYYIGAGDKLVGVMQGSDFPLEAKNKTIVGNYQSVSVEKIIQLDPDLIVAWPPALSPRLLGKLNEFGLVIYQSDPKSIAGISENIQELEKLIGTINLQSQALMQETIEVLREKHASKKNIKAVFLIAEKPLTALSNNGLIREAFALCRVENIFQDLPSEAAMVSREAIIDHQPDIILTAFPVNAVEKFLTRLGLDEGVKSNFSELNPDLLLRQTPRFLEGVNQFCNAVDQAR